MTDTKPTAKPSIMDRIREFLDSLGSEEVDETAEVEADAAEVDEDADQIDESADKEAAAEDSEAAENTDGDTGETPGTEATDAEDDDLRETIREQAAMIETYRNALAAAGLEDPLELEDEIEAGLDVDDTPSEDDAVAAFEADKLKQQALLASIKE